MTVACLAAPLSPFCGAMACSCDGVVVIQWADGCTLVSGTCLRDILRRTASLDMALVPSDFTDDTAAAPWVLWSLVA